MTFGSLFSGIGGIDLGLAWAGLECRWQVEVDDYCCKVLAKHWPDVKRYGDIRNLTGDELEPVDLVCGGFPCQDLSQAGKRAGIEGSRSGLWFEFARLVRELRPQWVLIENVPGLLVYDGMRRVVGELAGLGYVGSWRSLRAAEFGASHLRKRVFIVAHLADGEEYGWNEGRPESARVEGRSDAAQRSGELAYGISPRLEERTGIGSDDGAERATAERDRRALGQFAPGPADPRWPDILRERPDLAPALANPTRSKPGNERAPHAGEERRTAAGGSSRAISESGERDAPALAQIRGISDGLPDWLERVMSNRTRRLGRLGNAVVPQVAEWLGRKILELRLLA